MCVCVDVPWISIVIKFNSLFLKILNVSRAGCSAVLCNRMETTLGEEFVVMVESWARHWTALNRIEYKTKYIILILVEDFIFILFVFRHHARLVVPYPNPIHYIYHCTTIHNLVYSPILKPCPISTEFPFFFSLISCILNPEEGGVLLPNGILDISFHSVWAGASPSLKTLRLIHSGSSIQSAGAAL